ncbi:MAG TPA: EthD family reductase [Actinomycetota bacterium]
MVTMLVFYRAPADAEAFEKRYVEGHLPKIGEYQNIKEFSFHKVSRKVMGDFPYEYVFSGSWADKDGWKADLGSDAAKQATEDANTFAEGLFDVVLLEQLA